MTRVVLFDIDGTLIRTGGAGVRAFARTAEIAFGKPGGTRTMRFHGRTDTSLVREFLRLHDLADTADNVDRVLATYAFLLDEELERQRGETCPGVTECLAQLRARPEPPVVGLLTGNIRVGAALKLAAHGLAEDLRWAPLPMTTKVATSLPPSRNAGLRSASDERWPDMKSW